MEIKTPNFPKEYPKGKLPSSSPSNKIPARTEIKPFAGLPASTQPRPLKGALEK